MAEKRTTHGDRISALEEGYRHIGREVGGLREDVQDFMREVRRDMAAARRTQWSPILTAIAVVVAVVGGLVTLGGQPIKDSVHRHNVMLDRLADRIDTIRETRFSARDGITLREEFRADIESATERERRSIDLLRAEVDRLRDRVVKHHEADDNGALREAILGVKQRLLILEGRRPE